MDFIAAEQPLVEHIYFDENNVSMDGSVPDEVRMGSVRPVQPGRCVNFDATNSIKFNIPAFPDRTLTMCGWFNYAAAPTADSIGFGILNTGVETGGIRAINYGSGELRFFPNAGTNSILHKPITWVAGKWMHIAMQFEWVGNNQVHKVWINNELMLQGLTYVPDVDFRNNFDLTLGSLDGTRYKSKVKVFDVRLYNSFSEQVVADSFNGIVGSIKPKHQFKLDDGLGSAIALDSSGNNRHGLWAGLVASSHYSGNDVPYSLQNEVGYSKPLIFETDFSAPGRWGFSNPEDPLWEITGGKLRTKRPSTGYFSASHNFTNTLYFPKPLIDGARYKVEFEVTAFTPNTEGSTSTMEVFFSSNYLGINWAIGKHVFYATAKIANSTTYFPGQLMFNAVPNTGYIEIDNVKITLDSFVPRNEANPQKDILGNALMYAGRAPVAALLKDSAGGFMNGTHHVITTVPKASTDFLQKTAVFEMEFFASLDNQSGIVLDNLVQTKWNTADPGLTLYYYNRYQADATLHYRLYVMLNGNINNVRSIPIQPVGVQHFRLVGTGNQIKFFLNGVDVTDYSVMQEIQTVTATSTQFLSFGLGNGGTHRHRGMFFGFRLKNELGELVVDFPFSQASGTRIWNLAPALGVGTIAGDATVFWSKKQSLLHRNYLNGFSTHPYKNLYRERDINSLEQWAWNAGEQSNMQDCEVTLGDPGVIVFTRREMAIFYVYYLGFVMQPGVAYKVSFEAQLVTPVSGVKSITCQVLLSNNHTTTNNITGNAEAGTWNTATATLVCGSQPSVHYPTALCIKPSTNGMVNGEQVRIRNIRIELSTFGATYVPVSPNRIPRASFPRAVYAGNLLTGYERISWQHQVPVQEYERYVAEFHISSAPAYAKLALFHGETVAVLNLIEGTTVEGPGRHVVEFTMPKYFALPIIKKQLSGYIVLAVYAGNYTVENVVVESLQIYSPGSSQTDVLAEPLTNPAGPWYNYPETALDFSGGVASPYSLKVPTNWKGEPHPNLLFRKRKNCIDRICASQITLAGNQLLRLQAYTNNL